MSLLRAIEGIPSDVPVLILAGAVDHLATPAEATALYQHISSHGRLLLFPGADHNNLFPSALETYEKAVLNFCLSVQGNVKSGS